MIEGINLAARSLEKSNKGISIVANNLANMDTIGFKKDATFFQILDDYENPQMKKYTDFEQGEILPTTNPFDLALNGNAYFVMEKDDKQIYTRNGKFKLSEDGFLVSQEGFKVLGQNGEINLRENMLDENQTITISKSGEIRVGNTDVDSLLIVKVDNPDDIQKISSSNFLIKDDNYSVPEENDYSVLQGYLESSNVSAIDEMEEMIKISKNYESAQKVVNYFDSSLEKANEIGKV